MQVIREETTHTVERNLGIFKRILSYLWILDGNDLQFLFYALAIIILTISVSFDFFRVVNKLVNRKNKYDKMKRYRKKE